MGSGLAQGVHSPHHLHLIIAASSDSAKFDYMPGHALILQTLVRRRSIWLIGNVKQTGSIRIICTCKVCGILHGNSL